MYYLLYNPQPLDMNPLLPAFVRPPNNTPFGSVDLSLGGTSSRNNSNASPRTVSASPANPIESNFGNLRYNLAFTPIFYFMSNINNLFVFFYSLVLLKLTK